MIATASKTWTRATPWEALFQIACNELPDLHRGMVPFWVFDPEGGAAIERHVSTIPLSQDERRYEDRGVGVARRQLCRSFEGGLRARRPHHKGRVVSG